MTIIYIHFVELINMPVREYQRGDKVYFMYDPRLRMRPQELSMCPRCKCPVIYDDGKDYSMRCRCMNDHEDRERFLRRLVRRRGS